LPPWEAKIRDRQQRRRLQCELALREFEQWHAAAEPAETLTTK
jgi:hypothetical protein